MASMKAQIAIIALVLLIVFSGAPLLALVLAAIAAAVIVASKWR